MDEVSKSELKAKMFEYFRKVEASQRPLIVSDFGKPVLIIYPYSKKLPIDEVFKPYRGRGNINKEALVESETDEWGELS